MRMGTWGDASPQTPATHRRVGIDGRGQGRMGIDERGQTPTIHGLWLT